MPSLLKGVPLPVLLLVVSFLCPTELSIYIGTMRVPPFRAVLLVLLPVALIRFLSKGDVKLRPYDVLFLLFNMWTLFVYVHHHGQQDGLQTGGSLALDGFASYFIIRVFVRDADAFRGTIGTLLAAVALTGMLALPEALSGQILIHGWLRELTGYHHPVGVETRLGLTRAYGTFDHPIHLGTFCASALAMSLYATRRRLERFKRVAVIAVSALMGLSSAPMLSIGVQSALLTWDRVTRGIAGRLAISLGILGVGFAGMWLIGNRSPFAIIATGLTLDPWTGYYRLVIWENGLLNVWSHPLTGIGLNDWERPFWMISSTVDAFWLVIAMRTGIPGFLLLALAVLLIGRAAMKGVRRADPETRRMAAGWMMSLIAISLVACTVHFWNVLYAYFFFFLGLAGWLADPSRVRRRAAKGLQAKAPAVEAPVYVNIGNAPYPIPVVMAGRGPASVPRRG